MNTSPTSICKSFDVFSFFNVTFIFISQFFLFLFSSPLRMFVAYSYSFGCIVLFRTCLTATLATPCWPYKPDSFCPCLVPEVLAPPTAMLWLKMTLYSAELHCITNTSSRLYECKLDSLRYIGAEKCMALLRHVAFGMCCAFNAGACTVCTSWVQGWTEELEWTFRFLYRRQ